MSREASRNRHHSREKPKAHGERSREGKDDRHRMDRERRYRDQDEHSDRERHHRGKSHHRDRERKSKDHERHRHQRSRNDSDDRDHRDRERKSKDHERHRHQRSRNDSDEERLKREDKRRLERELMKLAEEQKRKQEEERLERERMKLAEEQKRKQLEEKRIRRELDEEFCFYLQFVKSLVLYMQNLKERAALSKWIVKLRESSAQPTLRIDYIKLILFCLQRHHMYSMFADGPPDVEYLPPFPKGFKLEDMMRRAIAEEQSRTDTGVGEGDTSCFVETSSNLKEYVAVQKIPNYGVHVYMALSDDPLPNWNKFETAPIPDHVLDRCGAKRTKHRKFRLQRKTSGVKVKETRLMETPIAKTRTRYEPAKVKKPTPCITLEELLKSELKNLEQVKKVPPLATPPSPPPPPLPPPLPPPPKPPRDRSMESERRRSPESGDGREIESRVRRRIEKDLLSSTEGSGDDRKKEPKQHPRESSISPRRHKRPLLDQMSPTSPSASSGKSRSGSATEVRFRRHHDELGESSNLTRADRNRAYQVYRSKVGKHSSSETMIPLTQGDNGVITTTPRRSEVPNNSNHTHRLSRKDDRATTTMPRRYNVDTAKLGGQTNDRVVNTLPRRPSNISNPMSKEKDKRRRSTSRQKTRGNGTQDDQQSPTSSRRSSVDSQRREAANLENSNDKQSHTPSRRSSYSLNSSQSQGNDGSRFTKTLRRSPYQENRSSALRLAATASRLEQKQSSKGTNPPTSNNESRSTSYRKLSTGADTDRHATSAIRKSSIGSKKSTSPEAGGFSIGTKSSLKKSGDREKAIEEIGYEDSLSPAGSNDFRMAETINSTNKPSEQRPSVNDVPPPVSLTDLNRNNEPKIDEIPPQIEMSNPSCKQSMNVNTRNSRESIQSCPPNVDISVYMYPDKLEPVEKPDAMRGDDASKKERLELEKIRPVTEKSAHKSKSVRIMTEPSEVKSKYVRVSQVAEEIKRGPNTENSNVNLRRKIPQTEELKGKAGRSTYGDMRCMPMDERKRKIIRRTYSRTKGEEEKGGVTTDFSQCIPCEDKKYRREEDRKRNRKGKKEKSDNSVDCYCYSKYRPRNHGKNNDRPLKDCGCAKDRPCIPHACRQNHDLQIHQSTKRLDQGLLNLEYDEIKCKEIITICPPRSPPEGFKNYKFVPRETISSPSFKITGYPRPSKFFGKDPEPYDWDIKNIPPPSPPPEDFYLRKFVAPPEESPSRLPPPPVVVEKISSPLISSIPYLTEARPPKEKKPSEARPPKEKKPRRLMDNITSIDKPASHKGKRKLAESDKSRIEFAKNSPSQTRVLHTSSSRGSTKNSRDWSRERNRDYKDGSDLDESRSGSFSRTPVKESRSGSFSSTPVKESRSGSFSRTLVKESRSQNSYRYPSLSDSRSLERTPPIYSSSSRSQDEQRGSSLERMKAKRDKYPHKPKDSSSRRQLKEKPPRESTFNKVRDPHDKMHTKKRESELSKSKERREKASRSSDNKEKREQSPKGHSKKEKPFRDSTFHKIREPHDKKSTEKRESKLSKSKERREKPPRASGNKEKREKSPQVQSEKSSLTHNKQMSH